MIREEEAEGSVMTAFLSLGRAIAVEGELKEHSEVSQQQSTKLIFFGRMFLTVSADVGFFLSRFSSPESVSYTRD